MFPNDPCSRCGGGIPNSTHPGAYPGALSRFDNATEICSACGELEAAHDMLYGSVPPPDQRLAQL